MNQALSDEDVERIRQEHPHNFLEHLQRVRRLLKSAQPGNRAWRILENEYGFQGDYQDSDAGEPPQGATWN